MGLTLSQYSSGETNRQGGISKKGSKRTRYLLVEAASALLTRCKTWSKLKAWGMKLQKKKGNRKAIVAVARKSQGQKDQRARGTGFGERKVARS